MEALVYHRKKYVRLRGGGGNQAMNNDLFSVKARIAWPQLLEWAGFQVVKDQGHKGTARCCRHGEDRTPSFFWNEERGFFCHGCAHGGDKIDFLMWVLGSDFLGAQTYLYQLAGISVEFNRSTKHHRSTKKHEKHLNKDLKLYRVFKLELDVSQLSYQVRKSILTHQLQALEENKEQVCLSYYYNQQQILDYKLALLDEEDVSVCFHLKKRLENYGRKYLAR